MRRTLLKVIAGLGVVGLLLFGLPRLIETEQIQQSLGYAASEALGSEIQWRGFRVGILPLRLTLDSATLQNQSVDSDQARLTAGSVELRLALLPIFRGRLQVDSLVLRDLELVVTRTETGLILPVRASELDPESDSAGELDPKAGQAPDEGAILDLAFHRLVVNGGRVIVRDSTLPTAVEWRFEDIDLVVRGDSSEGWIDVELSARLHSGEAAAGALVVRGVVSIRGFYELDVELEGLGLEVLQPYLSDLRLAGLVSGRASLGGTRDALDAIEMDLEVADLSVLGMGLDMGGELALRASRVGAPPAGPGNDLDLALRKPGGSDPAGVSGTLSVVPRFALDGPVELGLGLSLVDGGRLDILGTSSSQGLLDLDLVMHQIDLSLAQPFLSDPEMAVGGRATGTGRFVGAALGPDFVALDLGVEAGVLRMPEYKIDGPFQLDLKIDEPFSGSPRGRLALDLTAATLEYANQFKKRAGLQAEILMEFVPDESGVIVFESRIKLRQVDEILLRGLVGDSISVAHDPVP